MERVLKRRSGLLLSILSQPPAVLCASMMGNAMLLMTILMMFTTGLEALPNCSERSDKDICKYEAIDSYLHIDARAIMNIGHVGLMLIFMSMYWQGGKIYCFYSIKLSFLLMSSAAFGSTVVAIFVRSGSQIPRIIISTILFVPAFLGLISTSFGFEGFGSAQPTMSLFEGRLDYLRKYAEHINPNESTHDTPEGLSLAKKLHKALLVMTLLMMMEMFYSVFVVIHEPAIPKPSTFATHLDALVKAYTTMFHYTFVLATGYAAVTRLDDNCDMFLHGGGVFFLFDLSTVIIQACACSDAESLGNFGYCISLECRLLPIRVIVKGIALCLAFCLRPYTLRSVDRIPYAKGSKTYRPPRLTLSGIFTYSYLKMPKIEGKISQKPKECEKKEEEALKSSQPCRLVPGKQKYSGIPQDPHLIEKAETLAEKEEDGRKQRELSQIKTPGAIKKLQVKDYLYIEPRHWRVRLCILGVSIFAMFWCVQSLIMVFVRAWIGLYSEESRKAFPPEGSLLRGSPGDLLEAFSRAENYNLHGAAFMAFHISLSYQSAFAYPLFRGIHFASGSFILVLSIVQAALLQDTSGSFLVPIFTMRAICSAIFTNGFFWLNSKTVRGHFRLAKLAPSKELLDAINIRRKSRLCQWRKTKRDDQFYDGINSIISSENNKVLDDIELKQIGDANNLDDFELKENGDAKNLDLEFGNKNIPIHQCGAKNCSIVDSKQLSDVNLNIEDSNPQSNWDSIKVNNPVEEMVAQEKYMGYFCVFLTAGFLIKAIIQNVAAAGHLEGSSKVYGIGAFPGIMVRAPGYDVCFHVPYLAVLFLWHGVSSGNLVALDISRCLSASLIISSLARTLVLGFLWLERGLMLLPWRVVLSCLEIMTLVLAGTMWKGTSKCCEMMQYCSSDPLRTWRR